MKGSGFHLHAKVPPSANEGLASRRVVDEYRVVSDPIIASIHYEAFSKHLASYVEKGRAFPPSPLSHSTILNLGFSRERGHDSTTEAREAHSSAVPGTLYGRLR